MADPIHEEAERLSVHFGCEDWDACTCGHWGRVAEIAAALREAEQRGRDSQNAWNRSTSAAYQRGLAEGARAERSRLGRLVDARLLSFNISQDIRRCVGKAIRARSEGEP